MISAIRSLCFNDDSESFVIVLPSQYRVYRCEPFGMIFARECEDLSFGFVATNSGYRYIALTGSPSSTTFNSKSVKIFDHQTGQILFDQQLSDHVLAICLLNEYLVCGFHCKTEIYKIQSKEKTLSIKSGLNVHIPLAISETMGFLVSGQNSKTIYHYHSYSSDSHKDSLEVEKVGDVALMKFSRDGSQFATTGYLSTTISIWDSVSHKNVLTLERKAENDLVQSFDFSHSGTHFVTASRDGTVRIYEIRKKATEKALKPIQEIKVDSITMARVIWINDNLIGVISLLGDFHRITFTEGNVSSTKVSFCQRPE